MEGPPRAVPQLREPDGIGHASGAAINPMEIRNATPAPTAQPL